MDFFIGAAGALAVLLLVFIGIFMGWKLKSWQMAQIRQVNAEKLTQEEQKSMEDEQEAWRRLKNYTVEDAYGMNEPLHGLADKE